MLKSFPNRLETWGSLLQAYQTVEWGPQRLYDYNSVYFSKGSWQFSRRWTPACWGTWWRSGRWSRCPFSFRSQGFLPETTVGRLDTNIYETEQTAGLSEAYLGAVLGLEVVHNGELALDIDHTCFGQPVAFSQSTLLDIRVKLKQCSAIHKQSHRTG